MIIYDLLLVPCQIYINIEKFSKVTFFSLNVQAQFNLHDILYKNTHDVNLSNLSQYLKGSGNIKKNFKRESSINNTKKYNVLFLKWKSVIFL